MNWGTSGQFARLGSAAMQIGIINYDGRTDDKQIIAFINQGEGMQFAAVGCMLYDLARKLAMGASAPSEWFHQDKRYIP